MKFFTQLEKLIEKKNSLLCIGLDPVIVNRQNNDITAEIFNFNKRIIDETIKHALCYKPNIAFYEAHGISGLKALKKSISYIQKEIPVILDTKRNDIGNTAKAYAHAIFSYYNVDATTLNPYMGKESVMPFLKWQEKGLFLLCRTSNPGATAIQSLLVARQEKDSSEYRPFYLEIAEQVLSWSNNIGLVVAANDYQALKAIRSRFTSSWILAPGIGAQGGKITEAVTSGLRSDKMGIIPVVSRSISQDPEPGKRAKFFKQKINEAREKTKIISTTSSTKIATHKESLITQIIYEGCFKTGDFILKSGKKSPFYIDLRKIISNPQLLNNVAQAYVYLLKPLKFTRIAAIPVASLPIATCISMITRIPMIYPRIPVKKHGSGNLIEGKYNKGEKVVLIDDLISTGKSKFEALELLRKQGLVVKDLVVLIIRGRDVKKDLERVGLRLHSFTDINEILDVCLSLKIIAIKEKKDIERYLAES